MYLLKQEALKFLRSSFSKLALGVLLVGLLMPITSYQIWQENAGGNIKKYQEYVKPYEGLLLNFSPTHESLRKLINTDTRKMSNEEKMHHQLELDRSKVAYRLQLVRNSPEFLEKAGEIGMPEVYYNTTGISYIFDEVMSFIGMLVICGSMVVLIGATVFSQEHTNFMAEIIASSVHGRASVVHAKCMVVFIISELMVTVYYWGACLLYLLLFNDWNNLRLPASFIMPGNTWSSVMFVDMSAGRFIVLGYLYCILGIMAISGMTCLVSAFSKSSLQSIGICLVMIYLPEILSRMIPSIRFSLLPSISIQSGRMFGTLASFNVFDIEIFHAIPGLFLSPAIAIISFSLCVWVFCKRLNLPRSYH